MPTRVLTLKFLPYKSILLKIILFFLCYSFFLKLKTFILKMTFGLDA